MRKRATFSSENEPPLVASLHRDVWPYVYPALTRTESVVAAAAIHSQHTRNEWIKCSTVMRLATLRACWKIHKTATNITHSHYSLTRSLVYSCRGVLASSRICRRATRIHAPIRFALVAYWIHFEPFPWICMSAGTKYSNVIRNALSNGRLLWMLSHCCEYSNRACAWAK